MNSFVCQDHVLPGKAVMVPFYLLPKSLMLASPLG